MEGAYNSEMYPNKPKGYRKSTQEHYTCENNTQEHQKPCGSIITSGGPIQSSAKPKQQA